jgi:hypothetical protein
MLTSQTIFEVVKEVGVNLFANMIWVLLGICITLLTKFFFSKRPAKRLWGLHNPKKLVICAASTSQNTGKYIRYSTGIGQVRALTYITTSLNIAYKSIDSRKIYLANEDLRHYIENDIIILGGLKNNKIADLFLAKIKDLNIVSQSREGFIHWHKNDKVYKASFDENVVTKDYGIICKISNPFCSNNETKLILFAGCHTYGTLAAAKLFCENLYKKIKVNKNKNVCILVACDVINEYPVSINIIDHVEF